MLLGGRLGLAPLGRGPHDLVRGGLEPLAFRGAERGQLLLQFLAILLGGVGHARVEFRDLLLELVGQRLGVFQIFLRDFGELLIAGGGDADLLGRSGGRRGEGFERALAIVEGLILLAGVIQQEGNGAQQAGAGHQRHQGQQRRRAQGLGRAVRDEPGGAEKGGVPEQKRPLRKRGRGGGRLMDALAGPTICAAAREVQSPSADAWAIAARSRSHSTGLRSRLRPGETCRWSVIRERSQPRACQRPASHSRADWIWLSVSGSA